MSTITASIRVFNAAPEVADALRSALAAAATEINLDASVRVEVVDTDPETGGKRQVTTTNKVFAAESESEVPFYDGPGEDEY